MKLLRLKYLGSGLLAGLILFVLWQSYQSSQETIHPVSETEPQSKQRVNTNADMGVSEKFEIRLKGLEDNMQKLQESMIKLTSHIEEISHSVKQTVNLQPEQQPELEIDPKGAAQANAAIDQAQQTSQRLALLDNHLLATHNTDPTWAFWAETEVTELFNSSPQLNIVDSQSVQCSGAVCKIEVKIPKNKLTGAAEPLFELALLQSLAHKGMTSSSQVTQKQADGSVHKIFYMPREGHKLPKGTSNY